MGVVTSHFDYILGGLLVTVELTVLGYLGALVLGTVLAVFRVGPITPLRVVGTVYVEFFRNIPLLTLLILFVFGLPDVGLTVSLFWSPERTDVKDWGNLKKSPDGRAQAYGYSIALGGSVGPAGPEVVRAAPVDVVVARV